MSHLVEVIRKYDYLCLRLSPKNRFKCCHACHCHLHLCHLGIVGDGDGYFFLDRHRNNPSELPHNAAFASQYTTKLKGKIAATIGEVEKKRQVPPMLKKILGYDVQVTKKFVEFALKITALRSLRNHAQLFEVSCHGIVWLAGWLTFIWLFNNKDLYQIQVNMLIALILDIVIIAVIKAAVRRRRPVPMNKLLEVGPDKFSFPSGHASRATMIAFMLMYADPISILFYPPLLAWVSTVCITRVLAERHYILDVLGGVGVGILEGLLMCLIWFSQKTSEGIVASLSSEKVEGGEFHV